MNLLNKDDNLLAKIYCLLYPAYFSDEFDQINEIKNPHSRKVEDIIFFESFLLSCISLMFLHLIFLLFLVILFLSIIEVKPYDPIKVLVALSMFAFSTFLLNLKTKNNLSKKLDEKEYRWVELNHEKLGLPSPTKSMTRRELIPYIEKAYEYEGKHSILLQNQ